MAISKKDAKSVLASMQLIGMERPQIKNLLETLKDSKIKNKSFRKSIKKITKMLEQPQGRRLKAAS